MIEYIVNLWNYINDYTLILSLLVVGVFYLVLFRGIQFRYLKHSFTLLYSKDISYNDDKVNISPLQSFLTGLAARIGMGNIAGVATAIAQGGPGAVFWMWVAALLGMGTSFVENSLAQLYKTKIKDGVFIGGPAYYIRYGMKSKTFGLFFSLILAFTYGFAFVSLQTNQISDSLNYAFKVPHWTSALLLLFLIGIIIFSSLQTITKVSSVLIPFMSLVYILLALVLILWHVEAIFDTFVIIVKSAFNFDAAVGGGIGAAINYGVKRGLFSNEAGMGSSPNIAASANVKHPASQGFVQMIGIFFDTIVICSLTAFMIITAGVYQSEPGLAGASLAQASVGIYTGEWGQQLLVILIFLFAFTSVIGYYVYGSVGITYITENPGIANLYRSMVLIFVCWGAMTSPTLVWDTADVFMAIMTFINVVAILYLWKDASILVKDYEIQLKKGIKVPVFNIDHYPQLAIGLENPEVWQASRHHETPEDEPVTTGDVTDSEHANSVDSDSKTAESASQDQKKSKSDNPYAKVVETLNEISRKNPPKE